MYFMILDIDVLFDVGGVEQEGATEDSVDQRRLLLSQRLHPQCPLRHEIEQGRPGQTLGNFSNIVKFSFIQGDPKRLWI